MTSNVSVSKRLLFLLKAAVSVTMPYVAYL